VLDDRLDLSTGGARLTMLRRRRNEASGDHVADGAPQAHLTRPAVFVPGMSRLSNQPAGSIRSREIRFVGRDDSPFSPENLANRGARMTVDAACVVSGDSLQAASRL
jgi:hypothetical protein